MSDLHFWSIERLSMAFRRRELSPVEVVRAMLDRIGALDGKYHSYITVMGEQALKRAGIAEQEIARGQWRGPLHGIPLAAKDLFNTKDAPTSAGMKIYRDFTPDEDATVVARLYQAGAILLGKLNLTEGAYTNNNPVFPTPINPWNSDYWAGASSHGSGVATAAGLTFGALSTDTGGSIRFPSAVNSITGIKPTWGRVSRHGSFTLAYSFDHVGPFARSTQDAAAMLTAIAGPDDKDATALRAVVPDYLAACGRGVRDLRIGIDENFVSTRTDPEVVQAVEAARLTLQGLGARIRTVSFPSPYDAISAWFDICGAETAHYHSATYPAKAQDYQAGLIQLIEHGRKVSGVAVADAWVRRLAFTRRVEAALEDVDLMLIPTMTTPAPTLAQVEAYGAEDDLLLQMIRYTAPFDVTGNPTIVLPAGFSASGAPISVQLVSKHLAEELLCAAGHAFQQVTDFHLRRPIP
jgi:amidase